MNAITVKEICHITNGTMLYDKSVMSEEKASSLMVDSVIINSKAGASGTLFVPFIGETHDGHDYIPDAYRKGTQVTFTSRKTMEPDTPKMVYICVEDTLRALQAMGAQYRRQFHGKVIGVTGSVGKTSTKEMLAMALETKSQVLKTSGNRNGQVGVPLMMLELDDKYEYAVIEMGMSLPGEMERLVTIAAPDIAVITNIGVAHIGQLGTQENILKEKINICNAFSEKGGVLFVNGEDPMLKKVEDYLPKEKEIKIIRFGMHSDCDYFADKVEMSARFSEFVFHSGNTSENVSESIYLSVPGMHHVINATAALALAVEEAADLQAVKRIFSLYEPMESRGSIENVGDIVLIDDTYNASPDSMRNGMDLVERMQPSGRKIVVLADILELGELSKKCHYDVGLYVGEKNLDCLVTIGKEAVELAKGAKTAGAGKKLQVIVCADREEAFQTALSDLTPGDIVYMKGSHGMRLDLLAKKLRETYGR